MLKVFNYFSLFFLNLKIAQSKLLVSILKKQEEEKYKIREIYSMFPSESEIEENGRRVLINIITKLRTSKFDSDYDLLKQNSIELSKIKNLIFTSFQDPKNNSKKTFSLIHKKLYPLNIRIKGKSSKKNNSPGFTGVPEFIEEYLKENNPKKYIIGSKIDNRWPLNARKSPLSTKSRDLKTSPKPRSLILQSNPQRFSQVTRSENNKKTRFFNKSFEKISDGQVSCSQTLKRPIRHARRESRLSHGEAQLNWRISKLREIIKDPLIYGVD